MPRQELADVAAGRLSAGQLEENFADISPPLDRQAALVAAQRCLFCFDAPCIKACPTGIDIPSFIRRITTENLRGAALDILGANIFGGTCARVCPTEILCEGSCVRNRPEDAPVQIGALQRHATDWIFAGNVPLFERGKPSGQRVAVVGAGPAGLACAHALARAGHEVVVFDARDKAGGLNEYGIAEYKMIDFAAREIEWLLSIGGIEVRNGRVLGKNLALEDLRRHHAAVFLAIGLAGVNALGIEGANLEGVRNAVDFIAELRQTADLAHLPIGRRVVVIGGGNTAIDASVQSRKLGAENVTLAYRRGAEQMSATSAEREFAQTQGVSLVQWVQPRRIAGVNGKVNAVEFEYTRLDDHGRLAGTGETVILAADMVLTAVGQILTAAGEMPEIKKGRIVVDMDHATSLPGVWAGGDCIGTATDLTVQAVEDGKRAAQAIDRALTARQATRG